MRHRPQVAAWLMVATSLFFLLPRHRQTRPVQTGLSPATEDGDARKGGKDGAGDLLIDLYSTMRSSEPLAAAGNSKLENGARWLFTVLEKHWSTGHQQPGHDPGQRDQKSVRPGRFPGWNKGFRAVAMKSGGKPDTWERHRRPAKGAFEVGSSCVRPSQDPSAPIREVQPVSAAAATFDFDKGGNKNESAE